MDICHFNAIHMLGASPGRKHAQNARAAPYILHNLIFEQSWVLRYRIFIGFGPNLVLQHVFMNPKMAIRLEIVV